MTETQGETKPTGGEAAAAAQPQGWMAHFLAWARGWGWDGSGRPKPAAAEPPEASKQEG